MADDAAGLPDANRGGNPTYPGAGETGKVLSHQREQLLDLSTSAHDALCQALGVGSVHLTQAGCVDHEDVFVGDLKADKDVVGKGPFSLVSELFDQLAEAGGIVFVHVC